MARKRALQTTIDHLAADSPLENQGATRIPMKKKYSKISTRLGISTCEMTIIMISPSIKIHILLMGDLLLHRPKQPGNKQGNKQGNIMTEGV